MKHYAARTTMSYREQAATATAAKVAIAIGMDGKEYMMVSNVGAKTCWIGDSAVTSSSGYPIQPRGAYDFGLCTPLFNFYVIGGATATVLGIFET